MADSASAASSSGREISEKPSRGVAASELAFGLQHMFGMDHYQGANLDKLRPADLERLLRCFERASESVRGAIAREKIERAVAAEYSTARPQLADWARSSHEMLLSPGIVEFLSRPPSLGVLARRCGCEEVAPWLYKVDLLRPDACELVLQEAEHHAAWVRGIAERGSTESGVGVEAMPAAFWARTAVLRRCGLQDLEALLLRIARDVAALLYPALCGIDSDDGSGGLDWSFGYVASYKQTGDAGRSALLGEGTRKGLVSHTDDSEVTLNVCLGREYEGGELLMRGLRETRDEGAITADVRLRPGQALIHLGQHLHSVSDVTSGERHHLIVWTRSSHYRGSSCPCCILHRRTSCVCDAAWN